MNSHTDKTTNDLVDDFISRLARDHNLKITRSDPIIAEFYANAIMVEQVRGMMNNFVEEMQQNAMIFAKDRDATDIKKAESVMNAAFKGFREHSENFKHEVAKSGSEIIQSIKNQCDRAGEIHNNIRQLTKVIFLALGMQIIGWLLFLLSIK